MAKQFSDSAQAVLTFLQANPVVDITSKELAEAVGVAQKSITGVLTGLQKKGLVVREDAVRGDEKVKYIRLTDSGKTVDPDMDKVVL